MPAATVPIPLNVATEQQFRDAVTAMRGAIASAGGLVRTGNAGQIDPATVVMPATGIVAGYDVFRFDDALQATTPVFVRIGYARGTGNNHFLCEVRVSRATDGSIGASAEDIIVPAQWFGSNSNWPVTSAEWLVSSGPGHLCICPYWAETDPIRTGMLTVERTRDAAGVVTGDGTCTFIEAPITASRSGDIHDLFTGLHSPKIVYGIRGIGIGGIQGGADSAVKGADTHVLPIYPDPRGTPGRLTNLLACYAIDFQSGSQHVINGIGYRALTGSGHQNISRISQSVTPNNTVNLNSNVRRLMRFD